MGIFSLFGKKDGQQKKAAEKDAARTRRASTSTRPDRKATPTKRDAQLAQATVLKIDAIESEMSSEFGQGPATKPPHPASPSGKTAPQPASKPPAAQTSSRSAAAQSLKSSGSKQATQDSQTLAALSTSMGSTTDFLLHGNSTVNDVASPSSEAAAVIEESAIMYANGQNEVVEQMLRAAITEDLLGDVTAGAWWMLFDLYQLSGRRAEFEHLALEYTNKFEASPPAWLDDGRSEAEAPVAAGSPPLVSFSGPLDAKAARNTERVRKLAETHHALRLEFARVTSVDRDGCQLLLAVLQQLHKSGHDLVLVGARDLADKIKDIIEVGRRDDREDCWLLLLEILRLLNCEQEFEETSIDYCVTFEVSPPAFAPPQASVTTAAEPATAPETPAFVMPAVVEGRIDTLIVAIAAYSDEHDPAIIDCSQLARVDFNAAGRLLTGLAPFCGSGKTIEFHHVNHLVAALFDVIGLKDVVRIIPRKN